MWPHLTEPPRASPISPRIVAAVVDKSKRKLLRVPVKILPAGTGTVKGRILSVDTHTTEGNFTFHGSP
jgi:methionine-rich copper-binding protein CopC